MANDFMIEEMPRLDRTPQLAKLANWLALGVREEQVDYSIRKMRSSGRCGSTTSPNRSFGALSRPKHYSIAAARRESHAITSM